MSAATKKSNRVVFTARMDGVEFRKQLLEQGWGPAEIVRALRALTKQALAEWKEDKRNKRIVLIKIKRRSRCQSSSGQCVTEGNSAGSPDEESHVDPSHALRSIRPGNGVGSRRKRCTNPSHRNKKGLSVTDRRVRLQVGHPNYLWDRRTGTLGTRPGRRDNQETIC